jgi:hypothetical protein
MIDDPTGENLDEGRIQVVDAPIGASLENSHDLLADRERRFAEARVDQVRVDPARNQVDEPPHDYVDNLGAPPTGSSVRGMLHRRLARARPTSILRLASIHCTKSGTSNEHQQVANALDARPS